MSLKAFSTTVDLGDGRLITIETGKVARQANGAVTVRMGDCILFASVCATREPREGQSFFPLSVDYQEKFASAGNIPGSFFKREARLSDYEVLICRLVDRALRPLFPEDYFCEVQVIINLISSDPEVMPDALAGLAASAALAVSDVPIQEMISEVRVGRVNGEFIVNPSRSQMEESDMDFIIAASEKNIMMVEGESHECSEEDLVKALGVAHPVIQRQIAAQKELRELCGAKPKYLDYPKPYENEELKQRLDEFARARIYEIAKSGLSKSHRQESLRQIRDEFVESLGEDVTDEDKKVTGRYYDELESEVVRKMILEERVRLDGRGLDQVRPLDMEIGILPSPHGCALFTRGETQSLSTATLGTPEDELLRETAATSHYTNFFLHYNFPPYSTGEVKPMRGPGRREVGHGNLAMRSLKQMLPLKEYPYTVRVVSDILESNGSSSMATVCAGSLALMDAGVPIRKHVGGIAMGLISQGDQYAILTDILGDEDHLGDMDFKVTGTRDGICGVQMDIKVDGLKMEVMREALDHARKARLFILDHMYQTIEAYRPEPKPQAPRVEKLIIAREYIGAVIGPGGKVVQEIQRETGAVVNIEEVEDHGEVKIYSSNKESLDKAVDWIKGIVAEPEVGETYDSTVRSIMPYGAFVEFMPGKQGLLHISEVSWKRLENLDGIMKEGDKVKVKLLGLDAKTGKFKLSRKVLMPKPEGYVEPAPRREGGPHRGHRPDGGRRDDGGHHEGGPHGPRKEEQPS
jgi:polyribonucleotide nucleotidyltransferase